MHQTSVVEKMMRKEERGRGEFHWGRGEWMEEGSSGEGREGGTSGEGREEGTSGEGENEGNFQWGENEGEGEWDGRRRRIYRRGRQ